MSLFEVPVQRLPEQVVFPGSREGEIVEHLAAAKLLELGYSVARPLVDDGADFILYRDGQALTVQVKGRNEGTPHHGGLRYVFRAKRGWTEDLYLFYARDLSSWWVIPGDAIRARIEGQVITLHVPGGRWSTATAVWGQFDAAWEQIGEMFCRET